MKGDSDFLQDLHPHRPVFVVGDLAPLAQTIQAVEASADGADCRAAVRQRYLSLKPALDRASALVLGALGLRLLTDR